MDLTYLYIGIFILISVLLSEYYFKRGGILDKDFENYFDKNQGVFATLAFFLVIVFSSSSQYLFLSFTAYFIVFMLLSYLLLRIDNFKSGWLNFLYFAFLLFMIALLLFGVVQYKSLFDVTRLNLLIFLGVGIIGFTTINSLWRGIRLICRNIIKNNKNEK